MGCTQSILACMLPASAALRRTLFRLVLLALLVMTGVPSESLATTPFVNEVVAGGGSGAASTSSLALDAQGNPHLCYHDVATTDLKYARKLGAIWTIETADGSANVLAYYSSLALDAQGNPHVSHQDETNSDLKYARKSGGVWTNEIVDGAGFVGYYSSLALDTQGNPHVSYLDAGLDDLKYARKAGGVWTTEIVDSPGSVGHYTSLALDAQGNPHVGYQDNGGARLKYAWKKGGIWTTETADGSGSVGRYISLALDAQGNPHVSYQDIPSGNLNYARKSGGAWAIETPDQSVWSVGNFTSLALDAQGNPHVSHWEEPTGNLRYARKSGGVWTNEIADGSVNALDWTSLALDAQGNPHVSYGGLKYANAAVHLRTPSSGVTWAVGSRQNIVWSGIGPVDILISADGGTTYQRLETGITTSPYPIRVSHLPTRFARVRIERADPLSTAASDSFFTIDATIALLKFDAASIAEERSVRLSWATAPGAEAEVRYRLERASNASDEFAPLHAGLLDQDAYMDRDPGASARYRLIAVNGLGGEYVLGETRVAPALASGRSLTLSPSVSRGDEIRITFRVASEYLATELSIFDTSGRLVRTLVSGALPEGIRTATWDGRDESGRAVGPGVYLVRLAWGGNASETGRVTLVR